MFSKFNATNKIIMCTNYESDRRELLGVHVVPHLYNPLTDTAFMKIQKHIL
jgi:hypothetical protein